MTAKKPIAERAQDFYDAVFDNELLHLMAVADGDKNLTSANVRTVSTTSTRLWSAFEKMPTGRTRRLFTT